MPQEVGDAVGEWGKPGSEAGLVLRAEMDASSLRDVSFGWPWGPHGGFTLCCCVKRLSCST